MTCPLEGFPIGGMHVASPRVSYLEGVSMSPTVTDVLALLASLRWSLIDVGMNPGLLTLGCWLEDDGYEE
jgi:hypothetical protein